MPGGDRTGPVGSGPRTGRGAGLCAGYPAPGFMDGGWGRGGGRGWGLRGGGGGWRHRHWYHATGVPGWQRAGMAGPGAMPPFSTPSAPSMTREQELQELKSQASYFERALESLRGRIRDFESPDE
jgi:hypothetical protein